MYAPLGSWGPLYLVPDADAPRLQREIISYLRIAIPCAGLLVALVPGKWNWWVFPFLVIVSVANGFWFARGLPRAPFKGSELQARNYRATYVADAQATGRPTLWVMFGLALGLCLFSLAGALFMDVKEAWIGVALMAAGAGYYFWQLKAVARGG